MSVDVLTPQSVGLSRTVTRFEERPDGNEPRLVPKATGERASTRPVLAREAEAQLCTGSNPAAPVPFFSSRVVSECLRKSDPPDIMSFHELAVMRLAVIAVLLERGLEQYFCPRRDP